MHVQENGGLGFITAAAAILTAATSAAPLFAGKVHQTPWNFLYDDYPQKIWEAEKAIAELTAQPVPPQYSRTGGTQYQASMQAIVPKYVPGSEQMIANYDRRLNEAGGAYETTYAKQIARLELLTKGQPAPPPALTPVNVPPQAASAATPYGRGGGLQPVSGQPVTSSLPGGTKPPAMMTSSLFGNIGPLPLILGAAGIGVLFLASQKSR